MLKNNEDSYGSVAKTLHWLMALAIIGMFGLGLYMMDMDYYDPAVSHSAPYPQECWHFAVRPAVVPADLALEQH